MNHDKRITLVNRPKVLAGRNWQSSQAAQSRLILVDSFTLLRHTVASPKVYVDFDVERIVLDRATSASEYLALLAELPQDFSGDVVFIRDDDSGFLSAAGRGGNRVLYALSAQDLAFYLETHNLVTEKFYEAALPFRPRALAVA